MSEGFIWGEQPSETAYHSKELFLKYQVKSVLVPGAGYGRNTIILSDTFDVNAIELSSEAVLLARQWDDKSWFIEGSIFDSSVTNKQYDAVYCYDLLHLFTNIDRATLIHRCMEKLGQEEPGDLQGI
jgi:2-polyprenyl-3-methyl-5-hydroxy-6-metoxy-1,4-benzoquinol methylase